MINQKKDVKIIDIIELCIYEVYGIQELIENSTHYLNTLKAK